MARRFYQLPSLTGLNTFDACARHGSFTAAAERLSATQSTVSMRIQELERDFGVALFDRQLRSARVTAKGRELVSYAEQVLRLTAEIRERIGDHPEPDSGVRPQSCGPCR